MSDEVRQGIDGTYNCVYVCFQDMLLDGEVRWGGEARRGRWEIVSEIGIVFVGKVG
jgi:hypothetical protein